MKSRNSNVAGIGRIGFANLPKDVEKHRGDRNIGEPIFVRRIQTRGGIGEIGLRPIAERGNAKRGGG